MTGRHEALGVLVELTFDGRPSRVELGDLVRVTAVAVRVRIAVRDDLVGFDQPNDQA